MDKKLDRPKSLYVMIVSGILVFVYLLVIIILNRVFYLKAVNAPDYLKELSLLHYNVTSQVWWGVTTLITFVIFIISLISYIDTIKKQYQYYIKKKEKDI